MNRIAAVAKCMAAESRILLQYPCGCSVESRPESFRRQQSEETAMVIKSVVYHQLLDAGLWEQATARREQIRNELRQAGMPRKEASQEA